MGTFEQYKNMNGDSKLQRLRYHLACEGCSDSQLALAKSFLREASEISIERKENAESAIHWLLLSGSEGNDEALLLLENCYKMGIGVTCTTRDKIENCLHSSLEQKLAQRIGSTLFRLNVIDTQETIPLELFQKQVDIYMNEEKETHALETKQIATSGKIINMIDVVSSVHSCLRGEYPEMLLKDMFHINLTQEGSNFTRAAGIPKLALSHYLRSLGSICNDLSEIPLIATFMISILMCLVISVILPPMYLVQYHAEQMKIIETCFIYNTFVVLVVTSTRMFRHSNNISNKQLWAQLICKVGEKAEIDIPPHSRFQVFFTFLVFLTSLIIFLMFGSSHLNVLIQFAAIVLLTICALSRKDLKSNFASILFLLVSFSLAITRLDLINSFVSQKILQFNVSETGQELVIKASSVIFFAAVLIYLYLLCSRQFHSCLGLLVVALWLNLITHNVSQNGPKVLVFVILLTIVIYKKLGFNLTLCLMFLLSQFGGTNWLLSSVSFLLLIVSLKVAQTLRLLQKLNKISYCQLCLFTVLLFAFGSLSFATPASLSRSDTQKNVTWSKFSQLCHRPAWTLTNVAHTQKKCENFKGYSLAVEAIVDNVVRKYSNSLKVPNIFGISSIELVRVDIYEVLLHMKGTFRVEAEILLQADGRCEEFVLDLRQSDLLTVIGTLSDGIGTAKPTLILEYADCISCLEITRCHVPRISGFEWESKLKNVIKFFLQPLIKDV